MTTVEEKEVELKRKLKKNQFPLIPNFNQDRQ